jgi:hypothetical protein
MVAVLSEVVKKYEGQFGVIEAAESPKSEIGFKA